MSWSNCCHPLSQSHDFRKRPHKLEFHDADTDILLRILTDTSDICDFLKLFLWQANDTPTFSWWSFEGIDEDVAVGVRVEVVECQL